MKREGKFVMRHTGICTAAALLGVLASAGPALADFGAVAYDQQNCAFGRSWRQESARRAADVALAECAHPGCHVVLEVGAGQCGAVAITANCHGFGYAKRPSRDAAELAAMQECQKFNAGQCSPKIVDCNR
jgi:hypothetical protein